MALERHWEQVTPVPFTTNGAPDGRINMVSASGFYVKQEVILKSDTQQPRLLEIKRVFPTYILVGPRGGMQLRANLSDFLVADNATVEAAEQLKPEVPKDDQYKYSYAHEPANARRVIGVDEFGRFYNGSNPLPVLPIEDSAVQTLTPLIINQDITLANTFYTLSLPSNCKRFQLYIRQGRGPLRLYNASGAEYATVERGASYDSGAFNNTSLSIRYQSGLGASVLEVIAWVAT